MLMCIFSHRRQFPASWNILEHQQHDPRSVGANDGSLGDWTGDTHGDTHGDTTSTRPDHQPGERGPQLEIDEANDLDLVYRQRFHGVMSMLIGVAWPCFLLSLLCNGVLGVAWIHAKMSRCARKKKQARQSGAQQSRQSGAQQESRPMLPDLPSTQETDEL